MSVNSQPAAKNKQSIEYFYDNHPTEEDLMGYNELQATLVRYLLDLLEWLFRTDGWYIALDLNIYTTSDSHEYPAAPDVAVYKGVILKPDRDDYVKSWRIEPPAFPAPAIVFEVASAETWRKDLGEKPGIYARMGVTEYVYFDPRPRLPGHSPHLRVWRMTDGRAVELPSSERGWVWSQELESWLVPDGRLLRLYDRHEQVRQTGAEAAMAAVAVERAAKETERELKERAWETLRKLGVDPDNL